MSSKTFSAKYRQRKSVPSNCDEILFGERRKSREPDRVPEWEPPWVDNGKSKVKSPPKPLLFYCPTKASSLSSSPRTSSKAITPHYGRKYKTVKFSPTYVDESLFGTRKTKRSNSPEPRDFDPPWVREEKKEKPVLFEYSSTNRVFDSVERSESVINSNKKVAKPKAKTRRRPFSATTVDAKTLQISEKPPWR